MALRLKARTTLLPTKRLLDRDAILEVDDINIELLDIPEWGGEVYVRGLTGIERDNYEAGLIISRGKQQVVNLQNARAKLCALSLCDADGKPLFTPADVIRLGEKSASALSKVFETAQRLSGLSDEDVADLTENLGQTVPADSGSS